MMRLLFAPTVWLSGRLRFSQKYLLVGLIVLAAMAALSLPLWRQAREHIELAQVEQEGLRTHAALVDVLHQFVQARSQAMEQSAAAAGQLATATAAAQRLIQPLAASNARTDGVRQLQRSLAPLAGLGEDGGDRQQRFAIYTGVVNALLAVMRENAHAHKLHIDAELDAPLDLLMNRLPLVMENLGRQQDTLMSGATELASYALGAQVVLTEALPLLEPAILRLEKQAPQGDALHRQVQQLQLDIARQQEAADKVIGGGSDLAELRQLAQHNLSLVRALQTDMLSATEHMLSLRIERLQRARWVVAWLLAGTLGMLFYVFAGIYLSTLRSLRRLSEGTQAFCSGRLDTRIHIDTRDELVLVARNFNTVATEFEQLLEVNRRQNESRQRELEALVAERTRELEEKNAALHAAGARVQEELQLARDMQLAILPQSFPQQPTWQIHAVMYPARELGGDFYDCFTLPDGRCGLVVADVSGKGVGAAFFMAVSRTVLLDLAMRNDPPSQVLANANNLLCERNPMELFVTVFFGVYDPATGLLTYANAGHPPPLRRDAQGTVAPLACTMDTALGVMPGLEYVNQTLPLHAADTLLLYTDGVTEAFSPEGEAYGEDRLKSWLAGAPPWHGAQALIDGLVRDVTAFVRDAEASDDLTCLVLQHQPKAAAMTVPAVIHRNKRLLLEYELPSRTEEIARLATAVEQALPDRSDLAFTANLCLEELITNTIEHGLHSAPDRVICVRLSISEEWLEIVVKDDAPPFDPFAQAPAPDLDADVDARAIGGLGVHLVKTMMDDARAYYDGSGNLIVLLKTLRSE